MYQNNSQTRYQPTMTLKRTDSDVPVVTNSVTDSIMEINNLLSVSKQINFIRVSLPHIILAKITKLAEKYDVGIGNIDNMCAIVTQYVDIFILSERQSRDAFKAVIVYLVSNIFFTEEHLKSQNVKKFITEVSVWCTDVYNN